MSDSGWIDDAPNAGAAPVWAVYVDNLKYDCAIDDLGDFFYNEGCIVSDVEVNHGQGRVFFSDEESRTKALTFNGSIFKERAMVVSIEKVEKKPRGERPAGDRPKDRNVRRNDRDGRLADAGFPPRDRREGGDRRGGGGGAGEGDNKDWVRGEGGQREGGGGRGFEGRGDRREGGRGEGRGDRDRDRDRDRERRDKFADKREGYFKDAEASNAANADGEEVWARGSAALPPAPKPRWEKGDGDSNKTERPARPPREPRGEGDKVGGRPPREHKPREPREGGMKDEWERGKGEKPKEGDAAVATGDAAVAATITTSDAPTERAPRERRERGDNSQNADRPPREHKPREPREERKGGDDKKGGDRQKSPRSDKEAPKKAATAVASTPVAAAAVETPKQKKLNNRFAGLSDDEEDN